MKLEGLGTDLIDAIRTVCGGKPYNNFHRTTESKEEQIRMRNAAYQVTGYAILIIISIGLIHAVIKHRPGRALLCTAQGMFSLDAIQWARNEYHNADPAIKAARRVMLNRVPMISVGSSTSEAKTDALIKAHLSLADTIIALPLSCAFINLTY